VQGSTTTCRRATWGPRKWVVTSVLHTNRISVQYRGIQNFRVLTTHPDSYSTRNRGSLSGGKEAGTCGWPQCHLKVTVCTRTRLPLSYVFFVRKCVPKHVVVCLDATIRGAKPFVLSLFRFKTLLAVTSNVASYNNTLHPTAVTRNTPAILAYLLRNCSDIKMTRRTASRVCEHTITFHKYSDTSANEDNSFRNHIR